MTKEDRMAIARRWLAVGVLLFWAVLLALMYGAGVPVLESVALAVLIGLAPPLSIAQVPAVGDEPIERLPAYWSSIATLWVLGGACWLVGTRGVGPAGVGLVAIRPGLLVTWTTVLTVGALGIMLAFRALAGAARIPDSPILRQLLPRDGREKGVFALLSVAAGFGEEIAYRGFALTALTPLLGGAGALMASSLAFGIVHAYQGYLGVVRTTLLGAFLAWGYLESGSLWPGILAHVLIDIVAGLLIGDRLLSPVDPVGVSQETFDGTA